MSLGYLRTRFNKDLWFCQVHLLLNIVKQLVHLKLHASQLFCQPLPVEAEKTLGPSDKHERKVRPLVVFVDECSAVNANAVATIPGTFTRW